MSDFVRVTNVHVDLGNVLDNIENVANDEEVMLLVHAHLAKIIEPYVPYDTGYLSGESVEITPTGVIYTADYAWKQYFGDEFNHNREHHPLATSRWDEVAMQNHYDEFAEEVKEILIRRLNSGQE